MAPPTRYVDRSLARVIAYKRIVTGSISLAAAVALVVTVLARGGAVPLPAVALALALFVGGGAWSLRDGLRLRRELRRGG